MLQFGGSVGQSSEWSFKFVSLACDLFPREACKFSDSRTLAISAHFFPSLDCCMAVMNSKCLGNALVHCEVDHNHNEDLRLSRLPRPQPLPGLQSKKVIRVMS